MKSFSSKDCRWGSNYKVRRRKVLLIEQPIPLTFFNKVFGLTGSRSPAGPWPVLTQPNGSSCRLWDIHLPHHCKSTTSLKDEANGIHQPICLFILKLLSQKSHLQCWLLFFFVVNISLTPCLFLYRKMWLFSCLLSLLLQVGGPGLEQELPLSSAGCQTESGGPLLLQLLEFKTHLFEAVEELHIRRVW